ncbi:jg18753, partial [Pararge aegeria aegeria]
MNVIQELAWENITYFYEADG